MATLTKVKSFLSSWQNLLALGTLIPLGAWIYSRVWMVNPAILGDEYLYSMNSRKAAPWDPSPAGDFSNYLFNFVYQGTNFCGQAFYSCAKVFNLLFFLGFILTLFIVAIRFLPFWAAYAFMIASALSPLSVYTSMFLPESMYMFFIGLVLVATLRAIGNPVWQNWAIVGASIGLASLVKPHAWLSAVAVGITLLVFTWRKNEKYFITLLRSIAALALSSIVARVFFGLLVAGPKALSFFGQYLGLGTIDEVVSGTPLLGSEPSSGTSPMTGVFRLFGPQLNVHLLVMSAFMAISVVALLIGTYHLARSKRPTPALSLGLFALIWLVTLMIEIVIFTGWVTGTGDDHTTRVLLRYYEFLYLIVPLAGIVVLNDGIASRTPVVLRWITAGVFMYLITPAFTGFFGSLTIQIADAPTLAGLVVNVDVFNAAATIGFISLLVFAAFPKYSVFTYVLLLPVTMVATGFQIQDQYQSFRGELGAADRAGLFLRDNLTPDQIKNTWIISTSRFDATNIAIWADDTEITYELFAPGSIISQDIVPDGKDFVVTSNDLEVQGNFERIDGEGFALFRVR
jgi:hypothetical protein